MQAKRYNKGKLRYSLIPQKALEELAKVYTLGAHKYSVYKDSLGNEILGKDIPFEDVSKYSIVEDASNNWKLGQDWTANMESIKRHIAAWEAGEDIDEELGTYHLANAMWGFATLLTYYDIHKKGDNRNLWYKKPIKKVWLDLDGIIIDFETALLDYFDLDRNHPTDWDDYRFREYCAKIEPDDFRFWLSCSALCQPSDISYPIAGYCTSRKCSEDMTKKWLSNNGFPDRPILNVGPNSKLDALKDVGCEVFVDDYINTFVDLNTNGILCYLMSRPHNIKYDVGHLRVNSIKDFIKQVKK